MASANVIWIDGEPYSSGAAKALQSKSYDKDILNRDTRPVAELEPDSGHGALAEIPVQEKVGGRFLVRVTSFRRKLLDQDNLCEKFAVDLCRYSGIVPDDCPEQTQIEVGQEKVGSKDREFVRIEVFQI